MDRLTIFTLLTDKTSHNGVEIGLWKIFLPKSKNAAEYILTVKFAEQIKLQNVIQEKYENTDS